MKIKTIMAAVIMAATATTVNANVFNNDHGKAVLCSLIGESAANFARGRLIGMTLDQMKESVVEGVEAPVVKMLLSAALLAVYEVDSSDFFRFGERAPLAFSVATTKTCMGMGLK